MALVDWTSVQTRLHTLGFDPGPVDGIRGRRTMRAVKRFQESRGLAADGIVGHVGFYFAEDEASYHVLGGNRSNMVNVMRLGKDRLLTARWPHTALAPENTVVVMDAAGGGFSMNEA